MTTATPTRRRGFTLIEVLVVVSLIAVLMAIGTGAYMRVRNQQQEGANAATLRKLNLHLDSAMRAVRDAADSDVRDGRVPANVVAFCGGDPDRVRTVWNYLKLKNEFPTSFDEAVNPITITISGTPKQVLQPRQAYVKQFKTGGVTITGGTPQEQSAACFHLAITSGGSRGQASGSDGTTQQTGSVTIGGTQFPVYVDSYGTPIAFVRMASVPEVQSATYMPNNAGLRDPLDQTKVSATPVVKGKLESASGTWTVSGANNSLTAFWTAVTTSHIDNVYAGITTPGVYVNQNWVPTLVSAGPNRTPESPVGSGDDVPSYRLRREGNQGN